MTRLNKKQEAPVKELNRECRTPTELTTLLKRLFAGTLEQILQSEMDEHLGCDIPSPDGDNSSDSRNGYVKKYDKIGVGRSRDISPARPKRNL